MYKQAQTAQGRVDRVKLKELLRSSGMAQFFGFLEFHKKSWQILRYKVPCASLCQGPNVQVIEAEVEAEATQDLTLLTDLSENEKFESFLCYELMNLDSHWIPAMINDGVLLDQGHCVQYL